MSIKQIERITITKHLAVMIKSGISLSEALISLSNQSNSREVKKVLIQIKNKIDNGSSFADSLSFYPKNFDKLYLGIVKVGESSGNLDDSLSYLAQQLGKNYALKKKIKGALMYPTIILIAIISLITFISLFILPTLVDFFAAFDTELPFTTVILMSVASFMKNYGFLFFGSIFVIIFIIFLILKIPAIRLWKDRQILYLPFIGRLMVESEVATFSRNLATLIKSGLPIFEGLKICGPSQSNYEYQKTIEDLSNSLEKGSSISEFLNQPRCRLLFPHLVSDMVAVGEKTGSIDESLIYVSQFYEDDIEDTAQNLTTILEPVLLLFIGLIVAFVSLAIISPIYQLTGSLG